MAGGVHPTASGCRKVVDLLIEHFTTDAHGLALELWRSRRYEAQLQAAFMDDPAQVSARQMNQWAYELDNWADEAASAWVGRHALRGLTRTAVENCLGLRSR